MDGLLGEYIWIGWPMLLACLGASGGTLGGIAFWINWRIMKSERPLSRRYLLTGACSMLAVLLTAGASELLD